MWGDEEDRLHPNSQDLDTYSIGRAIKKRAALYSDPGLQIIESSDSISSRANKLRLYLRNKQREEGERERQQQRLAREAAIKERTRELVKNEVRTTKPGDAHDILSPPHAKQPENPRALRPVEEVAAARIAKRKAGSEASSVASAPKKQKAGEEEEEEAEEEEIREARPTPFVPVPVGVDKHPDSYDRTEDDATETLWIKVERDAKSGIFLRKSIDDLAILTSVAADGYNNYVKHGRLPYPNSKKPDRSNVNRRESPLSRHDDTEDEVSGDEQQSESEEAGGAAARSSSSSSSAARSSEAKKGRKGKGAGGR